MNENDHHVTERISPKTNSSADPPTIHMPNLDILVGNTLDGRFLIKRNLSEGDEADKCGIGLVYLAEDLKLLNKEVAVKILQESSLKNEDLTRKFQHEIEALIRLDHPNIVKILDSGKLSDGNPYMVIEYIHGYSLCRKLTNHKRLSFEFCAHIIESVTNALSAAHAKKILHRDIKPANIMLTPQEGAADIVRLIDFGIARVEDSKLASATHTERGIGTILYIAPEQLLGKLQQTPAADIYACAIVTYEMLTGKLPFEPNNIFEMFELQKQGVQTKPRQLRRDISIEAEELILQALAFDPQDRPQNARAFGRELADALRRSKDDNQTNLSDAKTEEFDSLRKTNPQTDKIKVNFALGTDVESDEGDLTLPSFKTNKKDFIIPNLPEESEKNRKPSKNFALLGLGVLALTVISSLIGYIWWKSSVNSANNIDVSNNNTALNTNEFIDKPRSEISYYLNVERMRSNKSFEKPFRSSGTETFKSGDRFRMVLESDADGYLYLFNESKNERGKTVYFLLHPSSELKNSAKIQANQEIETKNNYFGDEKGTEIFWIIWTKLEGDALKAIKQSAFKNNGAVSDEETALRLNKFLQRYNSEKNEITSNTAEQTVVSGKGDAVIHRFELEHK